MEKKADYSGLCELSLMHPVLTSSGHSQGLSLPDPRALRWWQWPLYGDKPPQKLMLFLCLLEGLLLLFMSDEGFP